MNKITHYFKGVNEEARRVRWPDQKTLWKAVGIVLVISIVTALFLALFDYASAQIMKALPSNETSNGSADSAAAAIRLINFFKGGF